MTTLHKFSILFALLCSSTAYANTLQSDPVIDSTEKEKPLDLSSINLENDPFVARLDSLININFFFDDSAMASTTEFQVNEEDTAFLAPSFSDEIYKARLSTLNDATPFELDFTPEVKRYIDVYSLKRREQVSRMLGLSQYYFPMFEEALDKYGMPLELKYLAIVESALNPMARSRVGATGLWQFMYATGKIQGLTVTSYIDERSDPIKSTDAACRYLAKLYSIFGDWNLALAAYNSGPGNVNKAIRRSGGKRNYWEIRPYLPRETAGYVPAFIAVNYIMNYAEEHYIYPSQAKPSYFSTDTISIKEKISFDQIASLLDISVEELEFLNPAYRYKIIPKNEKKPYSLILPTHTMGMFAAYEDSIYALAAKDFEKNEPANIPAQVAMDTKTYHKVQSGEVLGTIAEKYGVSVSSLKRWNGLRGNTIRVGQRLTVYPRKMPTTASAPQPTEKAKDENGTYLTHKVQSGESFYSIAKKYPGISAQNIMDWNKVTNAKSLKAGMQLKIYNQG